MSRKRERENPCFICNHYHDYANGEACSICGHSQEPAEKMKASAFPSEIIPDFLYVGSYDNATRSELLKAIGIKRILNLVPDCQNLYKNTFEYFVPPAVPGSTQAVALDVCVDYLCQCMASGQKVLVHCATGTSRSASVIIAFLMKTKRWRLAHSHTFVKQRRDLITLRSVAAEQLQLFERTVFGADADLPLPEQPFPNFTPDQAPGFFGEPPPGYQPPPPPPQCPQPAGPFSLPQQQPQQPQAQATWGGAFGGGGVGGAPAAAAFSFGTGAQHQQGGFVFGAAGAQQQQQQGGGGDSGGAGVEVMEG